MLRKNTHKTSAQSGGGLAAVSHAVRSLAPGIGQSDVRDAVRNAVPSAEDAGGACECIASGLSDGAADCASWAKHRLAVFDFDGTCLSGNSPVVLVRSLAFSRDLKISAVFRIACWAFAYKFQLPQKEESARALVFSAFEGMDAFEVDGFLEDFYDSKIEPRFRPKADAAMEMHRAAGCDVVVVSASFEPMIKRAMEKHPFQHQVSTRMQIANNGTYTRKVDGMPIEGVEKLNAIRRFADATFGVGEWEIAFAYGDHHSDETILRAAKQAFAVTPDKPLARIARSEGWEILDWS